MQKGFGTRSSLVVFVLINVVWVGLVAFWVYYSINNYQTLQRISLRFHFGPTGIGSPWVAPFVGGILMLFLLLGIIVIYAYYRKQAALNLAHENFISSVTHELRSPLSSLQLYLETLVLRDPEEATRREFLGRMREETERLSALIQNILWVSRARRMKVDYAFEWIPLSGRLAEALEEKRKKYRWGPEVFETVLEPEVYARCDWDNLKIALDNLVENSIRYSSSGFWLRVSLRQVGERLLIVFQDRGDGIPKPLQKEVFKMFVRGRTGRTRTVEGTGLGLYIVKNIVEAHGGRITVQSEGEAGKGTTFILDLPRKGPRPSRMGRFQIPSTLPFRRL